MDSELMGWTAEPVFDWMKGNSFNHVNAKVAHNSLKLGDAYMRR